MVLPDCQAAPEFRSPALPAAGAAPDKFSTSMAPGGEAEMIVGARGRTAIVPPVR